MLTITFFGFFALVLSIAGVCLIYWRWKNRLNKRLRFAWVFNYSPWFAIAVAIPLWSQDIGPEFAVVAVLLVSGLAAWACVLYEFYTKEKRKPVSPRSSMVRSEAPAPNETSTPKPNKEHSKLWVKINAFVIAGPIAGISGALLSLALTQVTTFSETNKFALSGFMLPLIWALLAVWVCSDTRWWRPTLSTLIAGALAMVVIQL